MVLWRRASRRLQMLLPVTRARLEEEDSPDAGLEQEYRLHQFRGSLGLHQVLIAMGSLAARCAAVPVRDRAR